MPEQYSFRPVHTQLIRYDDMNIYFVPDLHMMRSILPLIFLLIISPTLYADESIISDDGREVLIRDDGSWEFRSGDRYANTKDGRRIKLKADGTWVYVGNAPLVTKEQARTTTVDIKLQKVEFEVYKQKVHKNVRKESQTVFYINVDVSPLAETPLSIKDTDLSRIKVDDDKGKDYPVISITPETTDIAPDSNQTFVIRTQDTPSLWDGVKLIDLTIEPGVFGNDDPIRFSRKYHDIEEKNVKGFDKKQ
jgi:hypothetical protein